MADQLVALMYDVSGANSSLRLQILPRDARELVRKYHMQGDIRAGGYFVLGIDAGDVLQAADMLLEESGVSPMSKGYESWAVFEEKGRVYISPAESLDTMEDRHYYPVADFVFKPGQRAEVTEEVIRVLTRAD